ncbi:PLDc_N domain-containing protein [Cryobacterium cheniae]|uniref:PLDc_N domain-containing protein n=1 Tax=Cryobacterium cheniae TaxID=1259262 RepID=A0A4V3IIF3_9MICO|nr:PLD nuclease N-terminal domain-containing protein [Cryobacterium cheniae]TFC81728.1 PLDc_N domain-containing protein [Cryobacterium cheniae]
MNATLSSLPTGALIALAVLAVAQITLDVIALVDLYRRPAARVAFGNKWVWVAVILLANLIGAILYLVVARKPATAVEPSTAARAPSVSPDTVAEALYGSHPDAGSR